MIESSVVSFWEGDNVLPRSLVASVNTNSSLFQSLRTHEGDELEEEVGLRVEQVRGFGPNSSLKLLCVVARDTIPGLGLSPMHVVDAVGIVILRPEELSDTPLIERST